MGLPIGSTLTLGLFLLLDGPGSSAASPVIAIGRSAEGLPALSADATTNEVLVIEQAPEPTGVPWREWLRTQGPLDRVADFTAETGSRAFYRAQVRARTPADDWKNVVSGDAGEPFQSEPLSPWEAGSRWIKFLFLLDDPGRIYFQDSTRYDFHYDFAVARLTAFKGMNRAAFDAATLHLGGQQAVMGAVIFPPSTNLLEIGIQFVGLDPYPKERVAEWHRNVRARIQAPPGAAFHYLPAFEQADVARQNSEWFAGHGVRVISAGRWATGDECYSAGWALGRLVQVPGAEIAEAYRGGRLKSDDILLTDAVPAEVPPLAGIISLLPATPNSHVALLSQSFGIPFVYLATQSRAEAARTWTNRDVMIRANRQWGGCDLTVEALDGVMSPEARSNIVALHAPQPVSIPAKARRGQISLPVDTLKSGDVVYVGGKASNLGLLRRRIPANSPAPAIAFTFDVWDDFLDQPTAGGQSLRKAIQERLAGFAWPPVMSEIQIALDEVRRWITDDSDFTPAQAAEILAVLQAAGFDPLKNIRFRSSTNVEDNEAFSGAGLYDSYSGCLTDDLDADKNGPSACDPTEPKERGVLRALRKVFASFYNDNAYLERLRHAVDETKVGMAVLVHYSAPDEFELANGVATMQVSAGGGWYFNGEMVTQKGAVSVSNPDTTAVPETVTFSQFGESPFVSLGRQSSLVPLGGKVMTWESDYRALIALLDQSARGYMADFPGRQNVTLDFEYKRLAPEGKLLVKQIREVPQPPLTRYTPWLLNVPGDYELFAGEGGDVISRHRLKSQWRFAVRTVRLDDAGLAQTPFLRIDMEGRDGTNRLAFSGTPESLPGHAYRREADTVIDQWNHGEGAARREYQLRIERVRQTESNVGPLLLLGDHSIELQVNYATPQVSLAYDPALNDVKPVKVTTETARLARVLPLTAGSLRQDRSFKAGRVQVETSFWWPPAPTGPTAGYTAPVQAWIETRIRGLVSETIVLRHPSAQTYQPGHHNFYEEYAFEPRLDPGVPVALLKELEAANIKAIIVGDPRGDFGDPIHLIWGLDDTFRSL